MNQEDPRTLTVVKKCVDALWWISVVLAGPIMALVLVLMAFAPDRIPWPLAVTAQLDVYGVRLIMALPQSSIREGTILAVGRALFGLGIAQLGVSLVGLYQLRRILGNVMARKPFAIENADRLEIMGLATIGNVGIRFFTQMLVGSRLKDMILLPGVSNSSALAVGQLEGALSGLLLLVLAQIFRYGIRLQDEADLTV